MTKPDTPPAHPPLTDLIGLDPNFTGGLPADEYLRRQRCGECDEALSALAAVTADLQTARAVALSNKRAHQTAFEECERLASELAAAREQAKQAQADRDTAIALERGATEQVVALSEALAETRRERDTARGDADKVRAELARVVAIPGVAVLTAPLCPCRPNTANLHVKDCPVWVNIGPSLAQRQYVRRDSLPAAAPDAADIRTALGDDWSGLLNDDAAPVPAGGEDGSGTADGNREVAA